jgi:hypothetical protein
MYGFDELSLKTFLEKQTQLFDENIAKTLDEVSEFLSECMAQIVNNMQEVAEYFDEMGMDVTDLSLEELEDSPEVFPLEDGRFLVVIG